MKISLFVLVAMTSITFSAQASEPRKIKIECTLNDWSSGSAKLLGKVGKTFLETDSKVKKVITINGSKMTAVAEYVGFDEKRTTEEGKDYTIYQSLSLSLKADGEKYATKSSYGIPNIILRNGKATQITDGYTGLQEGDLNFDCKLDFVPAKK